MIEEPENLRAAARLDAKARRAANRAGFILQKSRARPSTHDHGGYMLRDADSGYAVAGLYFELDAADVVAFCTG